MIMRIRFRFYHFKLNVHDLSILCRINTYDKNYVIMSIFGKLNIYNHHLLFYRKDLLDSILYLQ
jgi:hypothetical protein